MLGDPVSEDAEHPEGGHVAREGHPAAGGLLEVVLGAGRIRRVSASRCGHGERHRGVGRARPAVGNVIGEMQEKFGGR